MALDIDFKNAVKFVVKIQIQTDYLASGGSVFLGRKLVIFPSVQNTRTIAIRANACGVNLFGC